MRRINRFTDLGDVFSARFIGLPFISGDSRSRMGAPLTVRARSLESLVQNLLDAFFRTNCRLRIANRETQSAEPRF
jgi:hypothetical protein